MKDVYKRQEQFAADDKKKREEVDIRNGADQMVFQTEKMLKENGDKLPADVKSCLLYTSGGITQTRSAQYHAKCGCAGGERRVKLAGVVRWGCRRLRCV